MDRGRKWGLEGWRKERKERMSGRMERLSGRVNKGEKAWKKEGRIENLEV